MTWGHSRVQIWSLRPSEERRKYWESKIAALLFWQETAWRLEVHAAALAGLLAIPRCSRRGGVGVAGFFSAWKLVMTKNLIFLVMTNLFLVNGRGARDENFIEDSRRFPGF